jgi:hypothetical protein
MFARGNDAHLINDDDTRRSMIKTTTIIAMIGTLTLGNALPARAQTPATADETTMFLNISVGGQFQNRDFSSVTTFDLFNENGSVTANQTLGSGFVFDATGGYRIWPSIAAAIGVSTSSGSGDAAALLAIPDILVRGKPTLVAVDYSELKQFNVAINFQIVWMKPLTDRLDLSVFGGPSVVRVKQELAGAVPSATSAATAVETQTETTAKAGTVGVDLSYRMNDRYGVGGFVRYAGGQVDLPAVSNFTFGGAQAGGGIRIRF